MIAPVIQLLAYADPVTGILEQAIQVRRLIAAIQDCQHNFIELDFLGVEEVSVEFTDEFFRLAESELAEIWITPRNYGSACNRIIKRLLCRLKQQREQAWLNGCERLIKGSGNQNAQRRSGE